MGLINIIQVFDLKVSGQYGSINIIQVFDLKVSDF